MLYTHNGVLYSAITRDESLPERLFDKRAQSSWGLSVVQVHIFKRCGQEQHSGAEWQGLRPGALLAWWLLVLKVSLPWCLHVGLLRGAKETERWVIAQGPSGKALVPCVPLHLPQACVFSLPSSSSLQKRKEWKFGMCYMTWMKLEHIMLSETCQTQKGKFCIGLAKKFVSFSL